LADLSSEKSGNEIQGSDEVNSKCGEKTKKKSIGIIIVGLILGLLLASVIAYKVVKKNSESSKAKAEANLIACANNLRCIKLAMTFYRTNLCKYPSNLQQVCFEELEIIPTCPSAGFDTYSPSYKVDPSKEKFVIYCSGHHHKDLGLKENFPQYYYHFRGKLVFTPDEIPVETPEYDNGTSGEGESEEK
jgi:hypothetical protein